MDLCTIKDANTLEVCVEVWGKYACFTRPENKVERFTYPCITPSAARNLLCTIYFKPIEFYYEVFEIEFIKELFEDYRPIKLRIWDTFTDTTLGELIETVKK